MLGGRGQGHLLGQYRLGPARLAHCMRWIAQAEMALDMMVDRSLNRYAHGSLLAEKQGIQWMIADSAMELYQAKLMVLHAAYKIDRGEDFKSEVSMAKHFVANMLNRVIDRSIQVHGALGYSTDTPLAHMYQHARWARFADGADEVHQMRIAQRTIAAYKDDGTHARRRATCRSVGARRRCRWLAVAAESPHGACVTRERRHRPRARQPGALAETRRRRRRRMLARSGGRSGSASGQARTRADRLMGPHARSSDGGQVARSVTNAAASSASAAGSSSYGCTNHHSLRTSSGRDLEDRVARARHVGTTRRGRARWRRGRARATAPG